MRSGARRVAVAMVVAVSASQIGIAQTDREGCEDYPLLTRLDGFYIEGCEEQSFASHDFNTESGKVTVEGHWTSVSYKRPKGAPEMAGMEMIRNHVNAIEAIGGKVLSEGRYSASMRVVAGGREIWIEVLPYGTRAYRLDIIEKQAMVQQVVADADALLADLNRVGHTVLQGVLFDTDKAVIKPESRAALAEIAKLLKSNPDIDAFVVGHTDMPGTIEHNLDLSSRRAAAVVDALVSDHGISADRLTPHGVGPFAPIASNASEAGRELNRRVELVVR